MRAQLAMGLGMVLFAEVLEAAPKRSASDMFAKGIAHAIRDEMIHRPKAFAEASGIHLRNPEKFSDQPERTSRVAQWDSPSNPYGVTHVFLRDGAGGAVITAIMEMTLSGRPCMKLSSLERAFGHKAHFGGMVMGLMALDGPQFSAEELGGTYAGIAGQSRYGRSVSVSTRSSKPLRKGCIRTLSLNVDRPGNGGTGLPVR